MKSTAKMLEYIREAEQRFQSSQIKDGSHCVGVFSKAAGYFETIMRQKLKATLDHCGVNYETSFRKNVPEQPSFTKLTLGQIVRVFKALDAHERFLECFHDGVDVASFIEAVEKVNTAWVDVKHNRKEVSCNVALDRVRAMNRAIAQLAV